VAIAGVAGPTIVPAMRPRARDHTGTDIVLAHSDGGMLYAITTPSASSLPNRPVHIEAVRRTSCWSPWTSSRAGGVMPRRRVHLMRFHGAFAAHAPLRAASAISRRSAWNISACSRVAVSRRSSRSSSSRRLVSRAA